MRPLFLLNTISLIIFLSVTQITHSLGQNFVERFNDLPPTVIVRAPEFDVEKKYSVNIDSANKLLIIQDYRRDPKNKQPHFDQLIYEIPLTDLSLGSFRVAKDVADNSLLNLKIGTSANKTTIIGYFLRNDNVVAIQSQDILELGPWTFSDETEKELKEIVNLISINIPDKSYKTNLFSLTKSLHKYNSEIVQTIGPIDSDKRLSDGYFYALGLDAPPLYSGSKNELASVSKLSKDIRKALKTIESSSQASTPTFVYINVSGQIESIYFFGPEIYKSNDIDLSDFDSFSPGKNGTETVKSKFLIMTK